nr:sugar phosphate isomerase/epimerase family protein [Knoellia sp. DB2414S]
MPRASLGEFVAVASAHRCSGVELRVGPDEPVRRDLSAADAAAVGETFRAAGLEVLALASYVQVCAPGEDGPVVEALRRHLELAQQVGAGGVRVFPGGVGGEQVGDDDARAVRRLAAVADEAEARGVRLLLETHDSHPRGVDVARVLGSSELHGASVGAIWDAAHPWTAGEEPVQTVAALEPWLAHTQVKDVVARQRGATPALTGQGVLPLDEVLQALDARGIHGPLMLEWEKAWFDGIPDLDAALAATATWLGEWHG